MNAQKRLLSMLLALILLAACLSGGSRAAENAPGTLRELANPFVDVSPDKYYYDAVLWAYYYRPQITGGTGNNCFSPNKTCTREQIMTFLWKANGAPEPRITSCNFTDVNPKKYYYKAVLWAVDNKISSGTGGGKFGVGKPCTRAQAMTFLWKAQGSPEPKTSTSPFPDVTPDKYYFKAVLWAKENKIASGQTNGNFGVNKSCTRAQIVTFLYKAMTLIKPLVITKQPKNVLLSSKYDTGTLSVETTGGAEPITYRWQRYQADIDGWENVGQEQSYEVDNKKKGKYRCVLWDNKGTERTSDTVIVDMKMVVEAVRAYRSFTSDTVLYGDFIFEFSGGTAPFGASFVQICGTVITPYTDGSYTMKRLSNNHIEVTLTAPWRVYNNGVWTTYAYQCTELWDALDQTISFPVALVNN